MPKVAKHENRENFFEELRNCQSLSSMQIPKVSFDFDKQYIKHSTWSLAEIMRKIPQNLNEVPVLCFLLFQFNLNFCVFVSECCFLFAYSSFPFSIASSNKVK